MIEVTNPFDHSVIGHVEWRNWAQIDHDLAVAHALHANKSSWLPLHQRAAILKKTASLMTARFDELAFLIANEGGKPLVDARVEVARAIDGVELCVKELSHLDGRQIPMDLTPAGANKLAFTFKEPIGPVVAVSAFNHPLNLIVHQVAPAVATGCPVLSNRPMTRRCRAKFLSNCSMKLACRNNGAGLCRVIWRPPNRW